MIRLLLASVALLVFAGCDSTSEPTYTRVPGYIALDNSSALPISVPAEIRHGVAVPVTVMTRGSTCEQVGDTEVAFVAGAVEIRPFDRSLVLGPNEECGFLDARFPHTVDVTFPEAGPIIIRAIGQTPAGEPQVYELGIAVR